MIKNRPKGLQLSKEDIHHAFLDKSFRDLKLKDIAKELNVSIKVFHSCLRFYGIKIPKRFTTKERNIIDKENKNFIINTEPLKEISMEQAIKELGRFKVNKVL